MADNSVDAIVTDPPYGLVGASRGGSSQPGDLATPYGRSGPSKKRGGFMGKEWDASIPGAEYWSEALRIAKPGAYILAFGGTRTFHRLAVAIEDAGWEIRDCVMWVYGSGFPKSHNLKGEREGWGTALKPAWEPIIVARKPLVGTVAANVEKFGTGAINVNGCRVGDTVETWPASRSFRSGISSGYTEGIEKGATQATGAAPPGRWPANLIHDGSEEVVACFPESRSSATLRNRQPRADKTQYRVGGDYETVEYGDTGSASRFFYCAKASKSDRGESNGHPTVKPTELMRYLVRLVTQPGGTVLDPFTGSGSTGKAAVLEGFEFIGIEREAEYVAIAEARIVEAQRQLGLFA